MGDMKKAREFAIMLWRKYPEIYIDSELSTYVGLPGHMTDQLSDDYL